MPEAGAGASGAIEPLDRGATDGDVAGGGIVPR
jgi:hypothetical protein